MLVLKSKIKSKSHSVIIADKVKSKENPKDFNDLFMTDKLNFPRLN